MGLLCGWMDWHSGLPLATDVPSDATEEAKRLHSRFYQGKPAVFARNFFRSKELMARSQEASQERNALVDLQKLQLTLTKSSSLSRTNFSLGRIKRTTRYGCAPFFCLPEAPLLRLCLVLSLRNSTMRGLMKKMEPQKIRPKSRTQQTHHLNNLLPWLALSLPTSKR